MENRIETLEEKVTNTIEEVTGRIGGVEKHKLQENTLKPTILASSNTCSNIKPPVYDGKTSWQIYKKQFEAAAEANNWTSIDKATALVLSVRKKLWKFFRNAIWKQSPRASLRETAIK